MHYIIYIDVLFVVNFILDYIVLSITAGILYHTTTLSEYSDVRRKPPAVYIKRVLAAVLGALWACVLLWFEFLNPMWNFVTVMVVGPVMVLIIMGRTKLGCYLKGIGILYVVTFMLGGIMHVIYYYTSFGFLINVLMSNEVSGICIWLILAGVVIGYALIHWFVAFIFRQKINKESHYAVIIEHDGKQISLNALFDTGNGLFDPIYGEPVNVVEADAITELIDSYDKISFHLIPYSSIGQEHGLIPVVKLNKLVIIKENEKKIIENPYFALYSGKFSANTEYRMILHPQIVHRTKG